MRGVGWGREGGCVTEGRASPHSHGFGFATKADVMTRLNRTVVSCPKCGKRMAYLSPANTADAVLAFDCAACGFQWVTMRPPSFWPDEAPARNDDGEDREA